MIDGVYQEQDSDPHVALRERLLGEAARASRPSTSAIRCRAASFRREFPHAAARELREQGLVRIALDEPLATAEFAAFGRGLGVLLPETDPATLPFAEDEVVLNLVASAGETDDVALQPFASGWLTLHSESSGRAAADQPRYIVLTCQDPGDAVAEAGTVLIPMRDVSAALDDDALAVLSATRYRRNLRAPMIARRVGAHEVFSFRDFWREPLEWTHLGPEKDADVVNGKIGQLLAAMYATPPHIVTWSRGLLIVIDNHAYFHGRSKARGASSRPRRLQRLRIL